MFDQIVALLNTTGTQERRRVFVAALSAFERHLQTQGEIRIFVDETGGMGHQSSSVQVMYRLIERFAYQNRIRIVYKPGNAENGYTVEKLAVLIPNFDPLAPGADINVLGATVSALPWDQGVTLPEVMLGFTGGADGDINFAQGLRTALFLRLQPYFWPGLEDIQLSSGAQIKLDEQFGESFIRRAYYFEPPAVLDEEWTWYETQGTPAQQLRVQLAHELVRNIGTLHLCPVYGVRELTETGQLPDETLAQLAASIQLANYPPNEYRAPTVLVCLDNGVSDASLDSLAQIFAGGLSQSERRLQQEMQQLQAAMDSSEDLPDYEDEERVTLIQGLLSSAAQRAQFLAEPMFNNHLFIWRNLDVVGLRQHLAALKTEYTGVAVFQLGGLPKIIFEKIYSIATLPSVFEGQGTANLALNLGNPYLHLPRPNVQENNYPDTTLQLPNATAVADQMAVISRAVVRGFTPLNHSFENSATTISNFIKGVYSGGWPEGIAYFKAIQAFYAVESNDKLLVSIVFLAYCMQLVQTVAVRRALAASAPPATLDELWTALNANLSGTTLDFIPGTFPSGEIATYYGKVAPGGVRLENVTLTTEKDSQQNIIRINVTKGHTSAFGFPMLAELEFTAPRGAIVCRGRYASSEPWELAGVPWIVLENGGFELTIYETDYPASGKIFATVRDVGLTVTLEYPTPEDAWLIQFRTAQPVGVETMFSIAGGVNLLAGLPPPLLALGGFGATGFDLLFRPAQSSLESVQVYLGTAQGWPIVEGRLEITQLRVTVAVLAPASSARRVLAQIEGDIAIGKALIRVGATVPEFQLQGELVAGVITIEDILAVFLPGVPLDLSAVPDITEFFFNYASKTGDYSVSCNLNVGWTISIPGIADIELRELKFSVMRLSGGATGNITAIFLVGESTEGPPLTIELSAIYLGSTTGWQFAGRQTAGTISLAALVSRFLPSGWQFGEDYNIRDVAFTIAPTPSKYSFFGATDGFWSVPFIPSLQIAGDLSLNYSGTPAGLFSGRISARIQYYFIDLTVYYAFGTTSEWGFTWGILSGVVSQNLQLQWVGTLKLGTFSLGEMVETMVSWATGSAFSLAAPWTFLNAITFSGIELQFNFTTNQVRLSLALNIELGFASLTKISITYDPTNRTGLGNGSTPPVAIELEGRFFWQVGEEQKPLAWDATRPETTPAPPGNGNQYLDLRLLALGQHVTIAGLTQANTVQKAIERMSAMKDPQPGKIPDVTFDAASAWLIGADFGVLRFGDAPTQKSDEPSANPYLTAAPPPPAKTGYLLTMQVVFNDPYLYGLRLALAGDAAKIFKGLDFQIMYRQVNETVGVYQAEITLPDVMRHLSVGVYSLTLPSFGIAVYTNGDFQVDVGFPWNEDFSRSFTIEAIIYPGIPVLGSAGFYFGKLSSASTDRVPRATNGTFNPVLVFGLGMQIGFGKSIEYGILRAGFSLTAVGILEGVLAKFNRYIDDGRASNESQLQGSYYFWLRGTFGIIGRLYGSVDFAIIKADVNVTVKLLLQLTYESFASMTMTVIVSVDVAVSVKIDLGLFSIKISFSFSMRLKESFTFDNRGTPPWITTTAPVASAALASYRAAEPRLRDFRMPCAQFVMALGSPDRWQRLLASPSGTTPLSGYLAPALTVAHDERDTTNDYRKQSACYVFLPLIDTVPESGSAAADTSFELLAKMILRWAIAAGQSSDLTPEQVDTLIVKESNLAFLLDSVLVSSDANPVPIPPEDVDTFLSRQFRLTLSVPPQDVQGTANTTCFPMAPALRLTVPKYGDGYPGCDYVFGSYNALSSDTLAALRKYFDELAVQVKNELGADAPTARLSAGAPLSMATWVLSDYFLLLTRQMVQAALDALRDFKFVLAGQSASAIVEELNRTGQLAPGDDSYTVPKLFAANPAHLLNAGKPLTIGVSWPVTATDSFERLAVDVFGAAVTAIDLATSNAANAQILRGGAVIRYDGTPYTVVAGNTLADVARHFRVRFADFLSGSPELLTDRTLLSSGALMLIPLVTAQAMSDSSFDSIAALPVYSGVFSATQLATQNAGRSILRSGAKVSYPAKPDYIVAANDTLADVALGFDVTLDQLFANSSVLAQKRLFIDLPLIVFPCFPYSTAAKDTLHSVATRFAISLETLGLQAANGVIADLFATIDEAGNPTPFIDVPHLVQYRVAELIAETQRALAIQQLSRLAGRYTLHGLRLPTNGIEPKEKGIWVGGDAPNYSLPPKAGLFALTGQEIELPPIDTTNGDFTMKLVRSGGPDWLLFQGGDDELTIKIAPGSDDALRIAKVRELAQSGPFDIPLQSLGADPMYESQLSNYPLTTVFIWQTPSAVALPYGPPPSPGQVPAMRFWKLPDALINLPDPQTPDKIKPRFELKLATYDEATGGTATTPIASYGWTSLVSFTIKRVPPLAASPATLTTYEIAGAGGGDVVLLERMVAQVGTSDAAYSQILLGYGPDATNGAPKGLQTDAPAGVTLGIAQVNLSTETRPPSSMSLLAMDAPPLGLLNSPSEFVRLLWEASITRAGGFYLYYYGAVEGRGLPERIFNDRGEANVSLIVIWAAGATPASSNRVSDFMNAAATGDSIDTARSVVFAEAAPLDAPIPTSSGLSLAIIAERTYSNVADLAAQNASLRLASGANLVVDQGTYQAPPGGISLGQIVQNFGLRDVAQLNAANPQWLGGLPDPLPYPVAIFLPVLSLTAGTSAHTESLSDIASYYGENLTTLAARNAAQPDIFASGQQLAVTGGPRVRHATVPAGTEAVSASRSAPPPIPGKPTDAGYASAFLLNTFSMLNYQVAPNAFLRGSNMGLPAGPTVTSSPSADKVRAPRSPEEVEEWQYRQAFPYPSFAKGVAASAVNLPPASGDPYRGVGSILQVDFYWQDYFGNTLITNLTSSGNQRPMLTGYVDPVLALSQWPSVSSAWKVMPDGGAKLAIVLSFSTTRYDGLITARPLSAMTLEAVFTNALDPTSATTVSNYFLTDEIAVTAATLGTDERTVTLTLSAALQQDAIYVIAVSNISGKNTGGNEDPPAYSGTASFHYPDDPALRLSSLRDNARKDLSVYTSLYYQLNDANGVALSVETSLLDKPVDLTALQKSALMEWLYTDATSIYAFIEDRAKGQQAVAAPPATNTITLALDSTALNAQQLFELSTQLTIRRTGGKVLGDLQTTSGLRSASTVIAPLVNDIDPLEPSATLGLTAFARDFEAALSVPGSHLMKVAGGVDRAVVSAVRNGATLWAVRVGLDGTKQSIAYSIDDIDDPTLFAPQPISNELQSRTSIPIYDYKTGIGISSEPSRYLNFTDIDMDVWGLQLFTAVDQTLTPEFTGPAQIVAARVGGSIDYLQQILDQKKKLAAAASQWMIPLYAGEVADAKYVCAAFYEQLLSKLTNAYATRAAIQFAATVNANIDEPLATQPPRLFGNIIDLSAAGEARSEITLTSPKLELKTASGVPLPFLLMAADNVREDGAVVPKIDLELSYDVTHIEHQIAKVPTIAEDYVASSWLSFIIPGETRPLTQDLGAFPVPMVLRAYPTSPSMVAQSGVAANPDAGDLAKLTQWSYSFVYSLPFHYPQDRVYCVVEFNINGAVQALASYLDAFPQLAQFVTVYPSIYKDLTGILATIDATTADEKAIHDAAVALASYIDLLRRITDVVARSGGSLKVRKPGRAFAGNGIPYEFHIEEGAVDISGAAVLLVTLVGTPPDGIGTPVVLVAPDRYRAVLHEQRGERYSYVYLDSKTNEYLLAAAGQIIPERTVSLPDMDILERQDAWSTILVNRNEELIPGRPTAKPFVYVTPDVQFTNPLFPTIDSSKPVDIGTTTQSLPQQLSAFFDALFKHYAGTVTLQSEVTYSYRIAPELEPVSLPIFMQPPIPVAVPSGLSQLVTSWSDAITSWFTNYLPSGVDGTLRFDLTIMSNLNAQPMPLLRLRNVFLPIAKVVPPLPTS